MIGPLFRPWTFEIQSQPGIEVARVEKRWSGLLQELFTDADNFSLTLPSNGDPILSRLVLAAALLIDFCFFENVPSRDTQ